MTRKTCKDHIAKIEKLAIAKWGEAKNGYGGLEWQRSLVERYVELENEENPDETKKATPNRRRSQIIRALEKGTCTADTLILLYAAVDCEIQVVQGRLV